MSTSFNSYLYPVNNLKNLASRFGFGIGSFEEHSEQGRIEKISFEILNSSQTKKEDVFNFVAQALLQSPEFNSLSLFDPKPQEAGLAHFFTRNARHSNFLAQLSVVSLSD